MDLYDIFAGAESFHTRKLLEHARALSPEQLDAPLDNKAYVFPWDSPAQSLRDLLRRHGPDEGDLDGSAHRWHVPGPQRRTARARHAGRPCSRGCEKVDAEFNRMLSDVRNRNAWSDTFVDALCEPAETFTFGGMFAHVITFNTYQRLVALDALRRHGCEGRRLRLSVGVRGESRGGEVSIGHQSSVHNSDSLELIRSTEDRRLRTEDS